MPFKWTDKPAVKPAVRPGEMPVEDAGQAADTGQDAEDGGQRQLELWPHRSLPRRGFAAFVLGTFLLFTVPLFTLLGTLALWGLLPFILAAFIGIWWGLERSYRSGRLHEVLTLDPEMVRLTRVEPDGAERSWQCNRYWAKADLHPTGGPVPHYVTLRGAGREVEIGAFLSEDERRALYAELCTALTPPRPRAGR